MKKILKASVPFFCILVLLSFSGCTKKASDEESIKEIASKAVTAVSKKDVPAFMKHVSKDYADASGNDHKSIKGILVYNLMRSGKITVLISALNVEVNGDVSAIDARVLIVRGKEVKAVSDILPEDADAMRFNVIMKKIDGEWKAASADWEHIGAAGLP